MIAAWIAAGAAWLAAGVVVGLLLGRVVRIRDRQVPRAEPVRCG